MSWTSIILTVNSVVIDNSRIFGVIRIKRRENEASVMDVTLLESTGVQDLNYWHGKDVSLVVDGVTAFTGLIDYPNTDVVGRKIALVCSDNRREILNANVSGELSSIGHYSDAVFSGPDDVIDELEQRLQTVPSVAELKPDGVYAITDINPKGVADYTLTNADVYRRNPGVTPASRTRLTNQVDLDFEFRYTRLRHRERGFKIEDLSFCDILDLGVLGSFTKKTTMENWANNLGWLLNDSSIVWEEMPASTPSTAPPCTVDIAYVQDTSFATSMTFDAATRFAQTITEKFSITVNAPQSIAQYGLINWGQSNGYEAKYESNDWESFTEYAEPTGGTDDVNDYYIDKTGDISDFNNAVLTAINIAKTKIIKSHRDHRTDFEIELNLDLNLTHTIALNTDYITAKGKVTDIEHTLFLSKRYGVTKVEIAQSTAQGAQVSDAINVPVRPAAPVVADAFVDPLIMPIADDDLITPAIDDLSRNEQVVTTAVTYNLEIQNDPYQVTFNG